MSLAVPSNESPLEENFRDCPEVVGSLLEHPSFYPHGSRVVIPSYALKDETDYDFVFSDENQAEFLESQGFERVFERGVFPENEDDEDSLAHYILNDPSTEGIWRHTEVDCQAVLNKDALFYSIWFRNLDPDLFYRCFWKSSPYWDTLKRTENPIIQGTEDTFQHQARENFVRAKQSFFAALEDLTEEGLIKIPTMAGVVIDDE